MKSRLTLTLRPSPSLQSQNVHRTFLRVRFLKYIIIAVRLLTRVSYHIHIIRSPRNRGRGRKCSRLDSCKSTARPTSIDARLRRNDPHFAPYRASARHMRESCYKNDPGTISAVADRDSIGRNFPSNSSDLSIAALVESSMNASDAITRSVPLRTPRRNAPPRGDSLVAAAKGWLPKRGIPIRGSFAEARVAPICLGSLRGTETSWKLDRRYPPRSLSLLLPRSACLPFVSSARPPRRTNNNESNEAESRSDATCARSRRGRSASLAEKCTAKSLYPLLPPSSRHKGSSRSENCDPLHRSRGEVSLSLSPPPPFSSPSSPRRAYVSGACHAFLARYLAHSDEASHENREHARAPTLFLPLPPTVCLSACLSGYLRFFIYAGSNSSSTRRCYTRQCVAHARSSTFPKKRDARFRIWARMENEREVSVRIASYAFMIHSLFLYIG